MSLKVEHDFQFLPRLAECEEEGEREQEQEKQRMRVTHKRHFNAMLCRGCRRGGLESEFEFELQFTKAAQNRTMMRGINSSLIVVRVCVVVVAVVTLVAVG